MILSMLWLKNFHSLSIHNFIVKKNLNFIDIDNWWRPKEINSYHHYNPIACINININVTILRGEHLVWVWSYAKQYTCQRLIKWNKISKEKHMLWPELDAVSDFSIYNILKYFNYSQTIDFEHIKPSWLHK